MLVHVWATVSDAPLVGLKSQVQRREPAHPPVSDAP